MIIFQSVSSLLVSYVGQMQLSEELFCNRIDEVIP